VCILADRSNNEGKEDGFGWFRNSISWWERNHSSNRSPATMRGGESDDRNLHIETRKAQPPTLGEKALLRQVCQRGQKIGGAEGVGARDTDAHAVAEEGRLEKIDRVPQVHSRGERGTEEKREGEGEKKAFWERSDIHVVTIPLKHKHQALLVPALNGKTQRREGKCRDANEPVKIREDSMRGRGETAGTSLNQHHPRKG